MLKSLGVDPKMIESVAIAVRNAANDLATIKQQNAEILRRLGEIERKQNEKLLAEVSSGGGN